MKSSKTIHASRTTGRYRAALALLALGSIAGAAHASEKVVRTPQGDVTVLTASEAAQGKVPALAAAHPFATERQRA